VAEIGGGGAQRQLGVDAGPPGLGHHGQEMGTHRLLVGPVSGQFWLGTDRPGRTRDSICVPFGRAGRRFTLIDTAGVRRRARVEDAVERASVARTLQAIAAAHVVGLVLDAHRYSHDIREGLAAFTGKRKPEFKGY